MCRPRSHLASRRRNFLTERSCKSTSAATGSSSPGAYFPTLTGKGNPLGGNSKLLSPRRATAANSESRDRSGTAPAALRQRLSPFSSFFLSFFLGEISWASPSPPIERVALGRRAPAAGLCARPSSRQGPDFLEIYFRSGCGGQPKNRPRRPKRPGLLPPLFLCSTPER